MSDPISAAASIIALVQAAGMLGKMGIAFHETFVKNDGGDLRSKDSSRVVNNLDVFIEEIKKFQRIQAAYHGTAPSSEQLGLVLESCKLQLQKLKRRLEVFGDAAPAGSFKIWRSRVKQEISAVELGEIDSAIERLLSQLQLYVVLVTSNTTSQTNTEIQITKHLVDRILRHQVISTTELLEYLTELHDSQLELGQQLAAFDERFDKRHAALDKRIQTFIERFEQMSLETGLDEQQSNSSDLSRATTLRNEPVSSSFNTSTTTITTQKTTCVNPGFNFSLETLDESTKVSKSVLHLIEKWMDPSESAHPILCLKADDQNTKIFADLCTEVLEKLQGRGKRMGYNGDTNLTSNTTANAIWYLQGQLRIPRPIDSDGRMPNEFEPDIDVVCNELQAPGDDVVYIILHNIRNTIQNEMDQGSYRAILTKLRGCTDSGKVRMLVTSSDPSDSVLAEMPPGTVYQYPNDEHDAVTLHEWHIDFPDPEDEEELGGQESEDYDMLDVEPSSWSYS